MQRRSLRFDAKSLVPSRNLRGEFRAFRAAAEAAMPMVRRRPRDMSLRDWAIYLLHNAAIVEHALMIQYLYAAYSLDPRVRNLATPTVTTKKWVNIISRIAVEEMGHLLTIQNILRIVGGPISFDRDDFPIPTEIYPFPFQLEPLTKDSLAKYVFAEMPAGNVPEEIMTAAERVEIEERAARVSGDPHGAGPNHVGTLYATLLDVFSDPAFAGPAASFSANSALFQQDANDFQSTQGNASIAMPTPSLLGPRVLTISSLQDVLAALTFIAAQGEASSENPTDSHFERFLNIYREFPEPGVPEWTGPPAFMVSTNPTTAPRPVTPGTIQHPITHLWARLFDLRYRMLLISLAHLCALPVRDGAPLAALKKNTLVDWIFSSFMLRTRQLSLSNLAIGLAQMPSATSAGAHLAGAPFGMPYSLAIPDQEPERWQYHLDLIASSEPLVADLRTLIPQMQSDPAFAFFTDPGGKLDDLVDDNALRRQSIIDILMRSTS